MTSAMRIIYRKLKVFPELNYILLLFIVTRVSLTILGVFSRSLLRQSNAQYSESSRFLWLSIWGVWDTEWYMDIAQNGYSFNPTDPPYQQPENYAFFPLYPMLVRGLGILLGNDRYYLAGLIISNVSLVTACILLYKLVCLATDDKKIALNSVKYLFLFPTAFIFSGVLTESIYLATALLCFYFAKQQKWLAVGISGFFLALSRPPGFLIILPMMYEYLSHVNFQLRRIKWHIIFLLVIPCGLVCFSIYNYYLTGDFLAFKNIQSAAGWERSFANPLITIGNQLHQGFIRSNVQDALEISFTLITLFLLIIFFKEIGVSQFLFSLYSIILPLLVGTYSMPRFILPIFPLYILLSKKLSPNPITDQYVMIFFSLLQGGLMIFWSYGIDFVV